jgi:hypothetical protein
MVEGFPLGAAHQDIAHQAAGTVGKAFAHIKDETPGAVGGKMGAIARRLGYGLEVYDRYCAPVTETVTEILASLALGIIAIGGEAIAKRTQGASLIVVTAQQPIMGVFVRLVTTQVNNPAGAQVTVDKVQDQVRAKARIASDSVHV